MLWEQGRTWSFTTQEFRSQGGDDSEENLITLCAGCHSLVHRCSS